MKPLSHFIESQQVTPELFDELCALADEFRSAPPKNPLSGKILASLFYEPSTRTRFSFESAMSRLGGSNLSTENASEFSSVAKGETLEDTIRVTGSYADIIVMRHNQEGASKLASQVSKVPIINAGDGKGQHPTQALLDVYTIKRELGAVGDQSIAFVGDLRNGRTVRSLAYLLSKFSDVKMHFVSPKGLEIGNDIKAHLIEHDVPFLEHSDLAPLLSEVDVVYMTRIQKERMDSKEYERVRGKFIITEKELDQLSPNARLMHPLPKIDEVQLPILIEDSNPRVAYFRQAENGLYMRMALLYKLLGE